MEKSVVRKEMTEEEAFSVNRIKHLSDQLEYYAEEVFYIVRRIQEKFDLQLSTALQVVDIATRDQHTDALHHIDEALRGFNIRIER